MNLQETHLSAIPPRPDPHRATPLSPRQYRHWQLQRKGVSCNVAAAYQLHGKLEVDILQEALSVVIARHPLLSCHVIIDHKDEPALQEQAGFDTTLMVQDMPGATSEQRLAAAQAFCGQDAEQTFAPETGPLIRAHLLATGDNIHVLALVAHRILCDNLSLDLLLRQTAEAYDQLSRGQNPASTTASTDFRDWIHWRETEQDSTAEDLQFWREQLASAESQGSLSKSPLLHAQPAAGSRIPVTFNAIQTAQLEALGMLKGTSLTSCLMLLYHTLLARHFGAESPAPCICMDGREDGAAGAIGPFLDCLPLYTRLPLDQPFDNGLKPLQNALNQAWRHRHIDSAQLESGYPLCPATFSFRRSLPPLHPSAGVRFSRLVLDQLTMITHLNLVLEQTGSGIEGYFEYNRERFDGNTVSYMAQQLSQLAEAVIEAGNQPLSRLPLLTPEQRNRLLLDGDGGFDPRWSSFSVLDLLAPNMASHAGKIAVSDSSGSLSYGELNVRVSQYAHFLAGQGVKPGDRIGIALPRSRRLLPVVLGILMSGATCVPLNPEAPADHLSFMVMDAELTMLLSDSTTPLSEPNLPLHCIQLDTPEVQSQIQQQPISFSIPLLEPDSIAFLIFIADKTGIPQGVAIPHRAVANAVRAMAERPGLSSRDRLAAIAPLWADRALLELLVPLTTGASVFVVDAACTSNSSALADLLSHEEISCLLAPPDIWHQLQSANWPGCPNFKALVAGIPQDKTLVTWLLTTTTELWYLYGHTETTALSSCLRITRDEERNVIGRPVRGTRFYVLEPGGELAAPGMQGELWIGGQGVANGYWNRDAQTREAFIANPFVETQDHPQANARLFRTGDHVRWREDGTLQLCHPATRAGN